MWPNLAVAVDTSDTQRSTAVLKLASVRASKAFALLVERRAKRTEKFAYFMTVVIGDGVGGRGELSYELGDAWGNELCL
jgi:hypothetical protein